MPPIAGTLNRLSCATMNQLYHPENTARFFELVHRTGAQIFTVSNNVVADLTSWGDEEHKIKTYDGVERFMRRHGLTGDFLGRIARAYYENPHGQPPRKAFDYYTAAVLCSALAGSVTSIPIEDKTLFCSRKYGVALVGGAQDEWDAARGAYVGALTAAGKPADGDVEFVRRKKESFLKEAETLNGLGQGAVLKVEVQDVKPTVNGLLRLSQAVFSFSSLDLFFFVFVAATPFAGNF